MSESLWILLRCFDFHLTDLAVLKVRGASECGRAHAPPRREAEGRGRVVVVGIGLVAEGRVPQGTLTRPTVRRGLIRTTGGGGRRGREAGLA